MRVTCLTAGLLWASAPLAAQSVLRGTVREDGSNRPLAGVEVLLEGSKKQTTTDNAGRFVLGDLPTGTRVILFRSVGYRPSRLRVQLVKGDTLRQEAILVPERAQELDPVVVTENLKRPRGLGFEAFEERRRFGIGKFLDSTTLRRYEGRRLDDVLRGLGLLMVNYKEVLPGGPAERGVQRATVTEIRAASPLRSAGAYCFMTVVLDGVTLYRLNGPGRPPDFRRELSTGSLAGVEYYRNAIEAPPEFGADADCGVLVLWTRKA